jgi:hypothetical protein
MWDKLLCGVARITSAADFMNLKNMYSSRFISAAMAVPSCFNNTFICESQNMLPYLCLKPFCQNLAYSWQCINF